MNRMYQYYLSVPFELVQHTRIVLDNTDLWDQLLACNHHKAARTSVRHKQPLPSYNNNAHTYSLMEPALHLRIYAMNSSQLDRIKLAGVALGAFERHDRNRDN